MQNLKYYEVLNKPINIDITMYTDQHNGLECVGLVQEYLSQISVIEPLILVLKHMLKVWGFNDPYHGGLSSYALFLMIVSFLQVNNKPTLLEHANLGELLLDFMKYYGEIDVR
jgi:non-canonical poly(A) RNA polymerase PAPD5/7